jgi:hypothetical protein
MLTKQAIYHQFTSFFEIAVYLFLLFGILSMHEAVVSAKDGIEYHFYGFAIINALVLGKVILVADDFHFAEWFKERAPIYSILAKAAAFTILLLIFDAVGLTPSRTPFHRNAGGIDDTVLDAGRRQPAVQPKPVVPGFVNRYHADRFTEFLQPESGNRDPFQGGVNVAPVNFVTTDGLAELRRIQADQPGRFAQFKPDKKRGNLVQGGRRQR